MFLPYAFYSLRTTNFGVLIKWDMRERDEQTRSMSETMLTNYVMCRIILEITWTIDIWKKETYTNLNVHKKILLKIVKQNQHTQTINLLLKKC